MLVLSRKLDESIVIGDNISVKIISIEKGMVKLGIDAPSDVTIMRSELLEDVKEANIAAATQDSSLSVSQLSKLLNK